jgi:hypothetical protein
MTVSNIDELKAAEAELLEAMNGLRRLRGEPPLPASSAQPPYCSFCGRATNEVQSMIAGPSVHICNVCIVEASRQIQAKDVPASP